MTSPVASALLEIATPVPGPLAALYGEIADCPRCVLARTRSRTVPGTGPVDAEIMFVGEAPGQREDEQGVPFVGAAGRFLDELLAGIGLSRDSVYIANVVKCRPPGNRDPEPEEIAGCAPFLDRQIEIIGPALIVTLGRFSMQRWFPGTTIGRVHGQPQRLEGRTVVPMYHPAAALHRGNLREVIHADFAQLPALLEQVRAQRQEALPRGPSQLAPPIGPPSARRSVEALPSPSAAPAGPATQQGNLL